MNPSNLENQTERGEPKYLDFKHAPDGAMRDGKPLLNRYSTILTREHDFPGAQVSVSMTIR